MYIWIKKQDKLLYYKLLLNILNPEFNFLTKSKRNIAKI